MMRVRQVIRSVKCVPLKLRTCHFPAIAILAPTSNTAMTYQARYACTEASFKNAKERPRYIIIATPNDKRTAISGRWVVRYFHEKYKVEVYWKNRTSRLPIRSKESSCKVFQGISLGSSNWGPMVARPTMTPKWQA